MSIIKLATKTLHEELELLPFSQKMFLGDQTRAERADYLMTWKEIFDVLDPKVPKEIKRLPFICYDLDELRLPDSEPSLMVHGYCAYLMHVCEDLRAHIYVNYMGLMYGGQIMKRRYPNFPTEIYNFQDIEEARKYIRSEVVEETDEFIIESKHAFRWHIAITEELGKRHGIRSTIGNN